MNRNLLFKDLKRNVRTFFGATGSVVVFIGITIGIYSTMQENMSAITEVYATMPKAIMEALNFGEAQWNTMLGFYTTYFVYYIPIIGGIFAFYLGNRLLAAEEQNKTGEFLLSRPLSRNTVVMTKLLVLTIYLILFLVLVYLTGLVSCGLAVDWDFKILNFSILHIYGLVFCLFIGYLGFFLSVTMKKAKTSVMTGVGIVMGSYMFDMMIRITDKAQFLSYLTPFKYMNIDAISPDYRFEAWRVLVLLGASAVLISMSIFRYRRKDILI